MDRCCKKHDDGGHIALQGSGKKKNKVDNVPTSICKINHLPQFMHPYIKDIIDVEGDGNCGYRAIALHSKKNEDDYQAIKIAMIDELESHIDDYLKIFGSSERLDYIREALLPPKRITKRKSVALTTKWFTFPDMGHIVASVLNRVVVNLTTHGASETFFPLRGRPPKHHSSQILCMGYLPQHYFYVKLQDGCPIPPTSVLWKNHCSRETRAWESHFLDRQAKFNEFMDSELNRKEASIKVGLTSNDPIQL